MKIVIVLMALLLLVWLLLGSARRRAKESRRHAEPPPSAKPIEGMVACAHCGVHLPSSMALLGRGRPYCSAAHRDGGPRAP